MLFRININNWPHGYPGRAAVCVDETVTIYMCNVRINCRICGRLAIGGLLDVKWDREYCFINCCADCYGRLRAYISDYIGALCAVWAELARAIDADVARLIIEKIV